MIGRAPMMMPPGAVPMPPMGMMPMQPPMQQPMPAFAPPVRPPSPPASQVVPPQAPPSAAAPPPGQPLFRGQSPEDSAPPPAAPVAVPRPAPLNMPSPEQLGVLPCGNALAAHTDWTVAHRRLDRLGALSFHEEKLGDGSCRVICVLPTPQGDGTRHVVEAKAATEAEAVSRALDQAEAWAHLK